MFDQLGLAVTQSTSLKGNLVNNIFSLSEFKEQVQSLIKQFTRIFEGDKKMKHRKRDPGSVVLSSRSNISGAMRGEFRKSQTLLLSEIKLFYHNMICQAN